jgi:hypothetical protein
MSLAVSAVTRPKLALPVGGGHTFCFFMAGLCLIAQATAFIIPRSFDTDSHD